MGAEKVILQNEFQKSFTFKHLRIQGVQTRAGFTLHPPRARPNLDQQNGSTP